MPSTLMWYQLKMHIATVYIVEINETVHQTSWNANKVGSINRKKTRPKLENLIDMQVLYMSCRQFWRDWIGAMFLVSVQILGALWKLLVIGWVLFPLSKGWLIVLRWVCVTLKYTRRQCSKSRCSVPNTKEGKNKKKMQLRQFDLFWISARTAPSELYLLYYSVGCFLVWSEWNCSAWANSRYSNPNVSIDCHFHIMLQIFPSSKQDIHLWVRQND